MDEDGVEHKTPFHRIIMNAQPNDFVDHINRDRSDCRKENLRICTHQQNDWNRSRSKRNHSGVTGVAWNKTVCRWGAYIMVNGQRRHLGYFLNKPDAIAARLRAEREFFGEFAPQQHLFKKYLGEDDK